MRERLFLQFDMTDPNERIQAFHRLRERMLNTDESTKDDLFRRASARNAWFTFDNVQMAWEGILLILEPEELTRWSHRYALDRDQHLTVGIVMAGNIPMVGFHDLLCVLIAGHRAAVKMSSQDEVLISYLIDLLIDVEPIFSQRIERRERLKDIDAVIATGSDNSARYFEYYFGKIPNVIRKNRTSVAILQGHEDREDWMALGSDIYSYFGLGCRNVSKVYIPRQYDITTIFPSLEGYHALADHHKYSNNYEYNKSIYLINQQPHLDTGFALWTESEALVSPISVTFLERYDELDQVQIKVSSEQEKIQCVVARDLPDSIPFGTSQRPKVWDYADNVDTLLFLSEL